MTGEVVFDALQMALIPKIRHMLSPTIDREFGEAMGPNRLREPELLPPSVKNVSFYLNRRRPLR
jgi:hypothetical protein